MNAVRKIIERCAGISRVAGATGQTLSAVHKWAVNGIPEKHWATLIEIAPDLSVEELHAANENVRQRKAAAPSEAAE